MLNNFDENGYSIIDSSYFENELNQLEAKIAHETWIPNTSGTEAKYISNKNKNYTDMLWAEGSEPKHDWNAKAYTLNHSKLSGLGKKYFSDYIFIFQNIIKSSYFTKKLQIIELDLWNGTSGLDWHWDGCKVQKDCNFFMMVYFTNVKQWNEEWGGYLQFGHVMSKINVNVTDPHTSHKFYKNARIIPTMTILPNDRTMVMGDNRNPNIVHRVIPQINFEKNRITFLAVFKEINSGT